MNLQSENGYRTGRDMIARAGFSFVMCGALAIAIYATHHSSLQTPATVASVAAPPAATVVASFEVSPGVSQSQAAVDASPAPSLLPTTIPIPIERVAQLRPVAARHIAPAIRRTVREPVADAPQTVSFESCLPGCETQDPLIVGRDAPEPQPPLLTREEDAPVETASLVEPRPGIIGIALGAPRAVYQTGRHALASLVDTAF